MRCKRLLLALSASVLGSFLAGCTYNVDAVQAFLREPRAAVSGTEYRVYPPDTISITSQRVLEIYGLTQQVRPDGKINLPLVGEIMVAGKTPKEIEEALKEAARQYYAEVDATVTVTTYASQKFYVFGQVTLPGPMPWTGRDSLLDALCKAQPTYLAWPERIMIVRGSEPQVGGYTATYPAEDEKEYRKTGIHPDTPEHPRHTMVINLQAMVEKGDLSNNICLLPNDVIYVQPNPFAKLGLALQSVLFPVRPVLEAVRVPAEIGNAGK